MGGLIWGHLLLYNKMILEKYLVGKYIFQGEETLMANYRSYMHIEKLGTTDTEGILNGDVYLFYKIDGTNSSIWLQEDNKTLGFGSRKKELSLEVDNANFMTLTLGNPTLQANLKRYFAIHPTYTLYGEWLVPHTIKRYAATAWKKLYIFDVYDNATEKYLPYDRWIFDVSMVAGLDYIPLIAKLHNPTAEEIMSYLDKTGEYLCTEGIGEGIVIKNYDFVNRYGRTVWAKVLTEDFKKTKDKTRTENTTAKLENDTEHRIIQMLTVEHIQKEHAKLIEAKGEWSSKYIFELLNCVWDEFLRDNFELILKKMKLPTINFKVLRQMSDNKVKEVLGL